MKNLEIVVYHEGTDCIRWPKQLMNDVKMQAKRYKGNLLNYVELVLSKIVDEKPNDETIKANTDLLPGRNLTGIRNIDDWLSAVEQV